MSTGPVFEPQPGWGEYIYRWLDQYLIKYALPVVILLTAIGIYSNYPFSNQPSADATPSPSSVIAQNGITESVRKGDSYTSVARRILGSYLIAQSRPFSKGQLLYAETQLVTIIKAQPLIVGNTITYQRGGDYAYFDFDTWMSAYDKLTPIQKQRWEYLARNIKF